jgi:hypothetical protein
MMMPVAQLVRGRKSLACPDGSTVDGDPRTVADTDDTTLTPVERTILDIGADVIGDRFDIDVTGGDHTKASKEVLSR